MRSRKVVTRCVLVVTGAIACAGGRGRGASAGEASDPASFDCHEYGTSAEFENLEPETREHLRSMCELEAEFEQFAAERRVCKAATDCTTVETSCPFGCATAVALSKRDEVDAKYEELSARFRADGSECKQECGAVGDAACVEGACVLERP